jgi:hypothetical protein
MLLSHDELKKWVKSVIRPREVVLAEQFAFGNREMLLEFFEIDKSHLILGEVQHGWAIEPGNVSQGKTRLFDEFGRTYPFYVWSPLLRDRLAALGHKRVKAIPSPWATVVQRLLKDFQHELISEERSRSIVYFPAHSIHGYLALIDNRPLLESVFKEYSNYEVTVCLFWLDYIDPNVRKKYEEFGFKVYCVGYRGSPATEFPWSNVGGRIKFLPELLKLLVKADLVFCDEVSTAFWAASSLGKDVKVSIETNPGIGNWDNKSERTELRHDSVINDPALKHLKIPIGTVISSKGKLEETAKLHFGWEQLKSGQRELRVEKSKLLQRIFCT